MSGSEPCPQRGCGHPRNWHSRNGCGACDCPKQYMDMAKKPQNPNPK